MRVAATRALLSVVLLGTAALSATPAHADDKRQPMAMHFRVDNDLFAGSDRGYTSGIELGFTSPTVETFDDEALPRSLRALNRGLKWLQPRGYSENNVTFTIEQGMFTPDESELNPPDPLDRPYAGMLLAGITYNSRDAYSMRSTRFDLGVVGPEALGEQAQDLVHGVLGADEWQGWEHQLDDELAVRLIHERLRKWNLRERRTLDVIAHYGGGIGNVMTFANAGAELRFGRLLPDDFGTAPAPYGSQTTGPSRSIGFDRLPKTHGFVAFDARYVLHNITLDGNTWHDSPSVDHEPLIADVAFGVATYWRRWKITVARYVRTKEFDAETRDTRFGSITFRRELAPVPH